MNSTILIPTVISAAVSLLTVLLSPWVGARLQRRAKDRIDLASVEIRRIDRESQFYDDLREELDLARKALIESQATAIDSQRELIDLRAEYRILRERLAEIESDVLEIRAVIEGHLRDHPEAAALADTAVRILDRIRRGAQTG